MFESTIWQLNPTDTGYLDAQCTGLGGGELDDDWDVLLACRKEAHVYGPSLSKQDDWNAKSGTIAGTAHTQEYLLLHLAMFPIGLHAWSNVFRYAHGHTSCKRKSSTGQKRCLNLAPSPRRIENHRGQDISRACGSSPNCSPSIP